MTSVVMEGFMLKKKRKALQGYARRYFRLSSDGQLSYAFNPHSPVRDSVSIPLAFISASRKHRTLDIDGGNAVYHCKCLSLADFDQWANAAKAFINVAHTNQLEHSAKVVGNGLLPTAPTTTTTVSAGQALDRVYAALAKLSQPICDLELVAHEFGQHRRTSLSHPPSPGAPVAPVQPPQGQGQQLLSVSPTQLLSPLSAAAAAAGANSLAPPVQTQGAAATSAAAAQPSSGGSKFRFLGKRSNSTSQPQPLPPPPPLIVGRGARSPTVSTPSSSSAVLVQPGSATPTTTGSSFPQQQQQQQQQQVPPFPPQQQQRSNSVASVSTAASSTSSKATIAAGNGGLDEALTRQLNEAISFLKSTHAELIEAVQSLPLVTSSAAAPATSLSSSGAGGAPSSGPDDLQRPLTPGSPTGILNRSFPYTKTHTRQQPSRASSSRASFVSTVYGPGSGGGGDEWFDAVAVPGEFVLDDDEGVGSAGLDRSGLQQAGDGVIASRDGAAGVAGTRHLDAPEDDNRSMVSSSSDADSRDFEDAAPIVAEDDDEDSGDEGAGELTSGPGRDGDHEEEEVAALLLDANDPAATASTTDERGAGAGTTQAPSSQQQQQLVKVHRRKQLPHPVAGDEFSMMSMLRKNIGKDLSTISFPVTMNEPLSALERLAEEFEYSDLLDRAAAAPADSLERLMYIAVFAVSGAAGNKYRSSRKPFNPLLGETYECIRPERGFRFISEKVSHHPPVLAFHSESLGSPSPASSGGRGWEIFGHAAPNQKFWGRSMEIFVEGDISVRFPSDSPSTVYSIRKPSSFVKNLVAGTKYIEIVGDLVVSSSNSKAHAVVSFKEGSSWGGVSTRNKIEGRVVDERGATKIELVGRWDDAVDKKEGKQSFTRLWQIADYPPNPERYYGFSYFTTTLNETTPLEAGLMAPTDSRLRPDQLALEHGDVDEAERLKQVVEEKQRSKRKNGNPTEPRWFRKAADGWTYTGEYFEKRGANAFADPDIFC